MKKVTKVIAAIMLITAVVSALGFKKNNAEKNSTASGYAWVDLDLPSGTLWATCNVGADTPEGYGNYFAWGETECKSVYYWSTYKYYSYSSSLVTKYTNCDRLTTLQSGDDAATANLGSGWGTPTPDQWRELSDNTVNTWTIQNGVYGALFTAANGESLFLPAAGGCWDAEFHGTDNYGYYWANAPLPGALCCACNFEFNADHFYAKYGIRYRGFSVRAVRTTSIGKHTYTDLGLPSGTLWATCNVGADTPEGYGDYFAWGETSPKSAYKWDNYKYANGSTTTKYTKSDGLTVLQPADDAATVNWGSDWCTPTADQWKELKDNTVRTWIVRNGVSGSLFTAANGNSIFMPAAGYRWSDHYDNVGCYCRYWSSSRGTNTPDSPGPTDAWYFDFDATDYYVYISSARVTGRSVRAVRSVR